MSKLLTELHNPFNACSYKDRCISRIKELEAEVKFLNEGQIHLNEIIELREAERDRLREALQLFKDAPQITVKSGCDIDMQPTGTKQYIVITEEMQAALEETT